MIDLAGWFGTLIANQPQRRTRLRIPAENVLLPDYPGRVVAAAEEHYVRLWLSEMFLENNSIWFKTYYPLVYSLITLKYAGQTVELANVSGKNALNIQQVDLGRTIASAYPLTPLLPFRGGDVTVDCGLVSIAASNAIQSFAGVVSDFAAKLGQAQASAVIGLATSIATGVQALLGAGNANSELYFHSGGAAGAADGTPLQSGYLFLSSAPDGTYPPDALFVTSQGLRTGTRDNLRPLPAQDYMLLEIQVASSRDDFRQFADIKEPFEAALDAKLDGESEKADLLRRQALKAAARNPDLTAADRKVVSEAIRQGFDNDGWVTKRATESDGAPSQGAFERALQHIDAAAARRLPDLTETDTGRTATRED